MLLLLIYTEAIKFALVKNKLCTSVIAGGIKLKNKPEKTERKKTETDKSEKLYKRRTDRNKKNQQ